MAFTLTAVILFCHILHQAVHRHAVVCQDAISGKFCMEGFGDTEVLYLHSAVAVVACYHLAITTFHLAILQSDNQTVILFQAF